MELWSWIEHCLEADEEVALLVVMQSKGSSPGRRGFKMAVRRNGEMWGSIGGGVMETRLVEEARARLRDPNALPTFRRQIHRAEVGSEGSGLICSGEQTVALVTLKQRDLETVQSIVSGGAGTLTLSPKGLQLDPDGADEVWFSESLPSQKTVSIIGGGHVGLALSRTMSQLGFRVDVYDDRENLATLEANSIADAKRIGPFEETLGTIPEGEDSYVAVVTFGFEFDLKVIRALTGRKFRYLGLMGSKAKLRTLFESLREAGVAESFLSGIHAPIGLPIHSHTPEEIAVSIAAEIIQTKNSPIDSQPVTSKLSFD